MPNIVLLASIFLITIYSNVVLVKMQDIPEEDYPKPPGGLDDYPMPPRGMDDYPSRGMPDDYPEGGPEDYPEDRPDPMSMRRRMRGRGRDRYGDYGRPGGPARKNEIVAGQRRFKLYEKKRLGFKKAKTFCAKKEGKLIGAKAIASMKKLQKLFMKARLVAKEIWIGEDSLKDKWDKEMKENQTEIKRDNPPLEEAKAPLEETKAPLEETKTPLEQNSTNLEGTNGTLEGNTTTLEGNKTSLEGDVKKIKPEEMCPAIGLSTGQVGPVPCDIPLPYICSYHRDRPRTTRKPKKKGNSTTTEAAEEIMAEEEEDSWRKNFAKDEMKK